MHIQRLFPNKVKQQPVSDLPIVPPKGPFVPNSVALSSPHMPVLGLGAPNAPRKKSTSIIREPRPDRRDTLSHPALGLGLDRPADPGIRPRPEKERRDPPGSVSGDLLRARLKNFVPHSSFPFFAVNSQLLFFPFCFCLFTFLVLYHVFNFLMKWRRLNKIK